MISTLFGIGIHSVWHWSHGFNNLPCDLVFIKEDPAKCYEAFDFGLCQALVSPAYGLRTSRAYHQDALNRKITYLLGAEGYEFFNAGANRKITLLEKLITFPFILLMMVIFSFKRK